MSDPAIEKADALVAAASFAGGTNGDLGTAMLMFFERINERIPHMMPIVIGAWQRGRFRPWHPMHSAPTDGTVVELCARYTFATAGFPRYGHFLDGAWRESTRDGRELVAWAWRERDPEWPFEGEAL
ncbi:hypothetical protein [Mesorhizobium sp. B1-1-7]|uniref:hypothetical protein n=1 Tax=Mesorhizobium sp. B1-1-7 TaxID=2589977 RepID=UPI001126C84C|nr:hypothetical protein [Mesorhizobium sp. B1-1-7]TPN57153.1 hypothetical protein FJ978_00585 [Mesorhizobium sp. B1-1-7]